MSRTVEELGYTVSPDVLFTIDLLTKKYLAVTPKDSGHTQGAPTWIYECPAYGGAEVAVRMNKDCLTLYMRDRARDGRLLSEMLPEGKIGKRYPRDGRPASSVDKSPYLGPSETNQLLMLNLERDDVEPILAAYFGTPSHLASDTHRKDLPAERNEAVRKTISAEDFQALLDRRSEVGSMGEGLAVLFELERLKALGCPAPERYVERVALTDVGRGYDIASTWPGHERFIEVKTNTTSGADFFISQNEWDVLAELGQQAWIYRVFLDAPPTEAVKTIGPDPMGQLRQPSEHVSPVVWRVADKAFAD